MPAQFYSIQTSDLPDLRLAPLNAQSAAPAGVLEATVPVDSPPPITAEQAGPNWFPDYRIDSRYDEYPGVAVLPVAGPPGVTGPKVVALHAGYRTKVVQWTGERVGQRPILPHWNTNNPYQFLSHKTLVTAAPLLNQDGTPTYRTSGLYTYVSTAVPTDADSYAAGTLPYTTIPAAVNNVQAADFNPTVLDASGASV